MRRARTQPDTTEGFRHRSPPRPVIVGLATSARSRSRRSSIAGSSCDPDLDPCWSRSASASCVLSIWPTSHGSVISSGPLRWGIVLMSVGFCAYAIDKERHLQKLSRLLTDERVLTAALSNRLRELAAAAAGRQGDERGPRARRRAGRDPAQRAGAAGRGRAARSCSWTVTRSSPDASARQPRRARAAGRDRRGDRRPRGHDHRSRS